MTYDKLKLRLEDLRKEQKSIERKITLVINKIRKIESAEVNSMTPFDRILELARDNELAIDELRQRLPYELKPYGYWYEEKHVGLQLNLTVDEDSEVLENVAEFLESYEFRANFKVKKIDILRFDCGSDGHWSLEYDDTTGWCIKESRWNEVEKFNACLDALEHIKKNHYCW